jgi:hypothetical protein
METGTTVSTDANSSAGGKANGYLKVGNKFIFFEHSITTNIALTAGKTFGKSEEYSLTENVTRQAFTTGSVPSRECSASESPYLDTCYQSKDGKKEVELWAPHTEGTLFTSTLNASKYALFNNETNKLVGYTVDFSDAAVTDETINFKINPAYLYAGSLDGYIGPKKVPGIGNSYFNPREENAWRSDAKRQDAELLARYKARTDSDGTTAAQFVQDKLLISSVAVSDGGYNSKNSTAAASITDNFGYEIGLDVDVNYDMETALTGAGFGVGVGGYYTRNFSQAKNQSQSINFTASIDRGVVSEVQDDNNNTLPYAVDKYNARSYFIPANDTNLKFFFERVVSPHLLSGVNLHGSEIETAKLLNKIRTGTGKVWRVAHRVDGVSRYIPNPN